MNPIYSKLVKTGVLGAVLAWALWRESVTTAKLFTLIENNTTAFQLLRAESCIDICREVAK